MSGYDPKRTIARVDSENIYGDDFREIMMSHDLGPRFPRSTNVPSLYFPENSKFLRDGAAGLVTISISSRTTPNGTNCQAATQAAMRHAVKA